MTPLLLTTIAAFAPQAPATIAGATSPPTGIAARHPGDIDIAADPAVLFATGFEAGFAGWTRTNARIFTLVDDAAFAQSGRCCALATATRGKDTGGELTLRLPQGQPTLHVRFYCRFAPDTCWPHHFVKLRALTPGFDGRAGVAPPGDRGFWTGIEPLRGQWRCYTYWHAMRGWNNPGPDPRTNDDGSGFTPDGQPPVPRDRWICVEAMLKANTIGHADGELAFWIDGVLVGQYRPGVPVGSWARNVFVTSGPRNTRPQPFPGFVFRTAPEVLPNELGLQWYVSEEYAAKGTAERNRVWFDDIVVATAYIGPMLHQKRD
jgi:hypothetical protein